MMLSHAAWKVGCPPSASHQLDPVLVPFSNVGESYLQALQSLGIGVRLAADSLTFKASIPLLLANH